MDKDLFGVGLAPVFEGNGEKFFICQYTGLHVNKRYGVPGRWPGRMKGTFADPSCLMAFLTEQVKKGEMTRAQYQAYETNVRRAAKQQGTGYPLPIAPRPEGLSINSGNMRKHEYFALYRGEGEDAREYESHWMTGWGQTMSDYEELNEKHRKQNAERQAHFREKTRNSRPEFAYLVGNTSRILSPSEMGSTGGRPQDTNPLLHWFLLNRILDSDLEAFSSTQTNAPISVLVTFVGELFWDPRSGGVINECANNLLRGHGYPALQVRGPALEVRYPKTDDDAAGENLTLVEYVPLEEQPLLHQQDEENIVIQANPDEDDDEDHDEDDDEDDDEAEEEGNLRRSVPHKISKGRMKHLRKILETRGRKTRKRSKKVVQWKKPLEDVAPPSSQMQQEEEEED